jgi:hypothetical protein
MARSRPSESPRRRTTLTASVVAGGSRRAVAFTRAPRPDDERNSAVAVDTDGACLEWARDPEGGSIYSLALDEAAQARH